MSTTTRIRAVRDERVDGRFPVRWHAADPRDARVAGSDTDAIRINVITTRACMAKASGRSTRHGGGFLARQHRGGIGRLFANRLDAHADPRETGSVAQTPRLRILAGRGPLAMMTG